jgi:hypothetical protein
MRALIKRKLFLAMCGVAIAIVGLAMPMFAYFRNSSPTSRKALVGTAPAAVSPDGKSIFCFYVGLNRSIWLRIWDGRTWGDEVDLLLPCAYSPATVTAKGKVYLFFRGTDRKLWWRIWNGSKWNDAEVVGGVLTSGPTALTVGDTLRVFYRGDDRHLWTRAWDGKAWNDEQNLGGLLHAEGGN